MTGPLDTSRDELDTTSLRTTVAVLVTLAAVLIGALVAAVMWKGSQRFAANPDDRPAFSDATAAPMPDGRVRFTPAPISPETARALLVHGRSARVAS